jgi:hypothetical protein
MNLPTIPVSPAKLAPWIMIAIAAGYFVFLIATWISFTNERDERMSYYDVLLDKIDQFGKGGSGE